MAQPYGCWSGCLMNPLRSKAVCRQVTYGCYTRPRSQRCSVWVNGTSGVPGSDNEAFDTKIHPKDTSH